MHHRFIAVLAAALFIVTTAVPALAGPVNSTIFGTAIKGYDPVAYHTLGRPVEGSKQFTNKWNGATWRFANAEHRNLFAANPKRYTPAYGGYCAYAFAQGRKVDIDPTAWNIVGGTLYLNFNKVVQELWEQDIPDYIASADAHWARQTA